MPKFQYKTKSAEKSAAQIGYLEAPDVQAAQKYLKKKGLQVEWVRGAGRSKSQADSADLIVEAGNKFVYGRDHDVGKYRPSVADFVQDQRPSKEAIRLTLALCSLLGVLVLVATWGRSVPPAQRQSNQEVHYKVHLVGRITPTTTPEDLSLTVSIPEIPYQQTWKGAEAFDDNGHIKRDIEFLTRRQAGHCDVELSRPGRGTLQKRRFALSGFESTIDLGTLSFTPSSSEGYQK